VKLAESGSVAGLSEQIAERGRFCFHSFPTWPTVQNKCKTVSRAVGASIWGQIVREKGTSDQTVHPILRPSIEELRSARR